MCIESERKIMESAFVLISTEMGSESDVLKALRKIDGIVEAYDTFGIYDVIAKVEAHSMEELKKIMTDKIRKLDNVRSTITMIVTKDNAK